MDDNVISFEAGRQARQDKQNASTTHAALPAVLSPKARVTDFIAQVYHMEQRLRQQEIVIAELTQKVARAETLIDELEQAHARLQHMLHLFADALTQV